MRGTGRKRRLARSREQKVRVQPYRRATIETDARASNVGASNPPLNASRYTRRDRGRT